MTRHSLLSHALGLALVPWLLTAAPAQAVSVSLPIAINQGRAQMIDIRPGVGVNNIPNSSNPTNITPLGDRVLFVADMGDIRGKELWISDGTAAGTNRVANLVPMVAGAMDEKDDVGHIAVRNGQAFFAGRHPTQGLEVWVTDGTASGTRLHVDINFGAGDSNPEYLTRIGHKIFFAAENGAGAEPFCMNRNGVWQIADIRPGTDPTTGLPLGSNPRYFAGFPDKVVFQADDGVSGRELWVTDGWTASQLLDIYPGMTGAQINSGFPEHMTAVSPGLNGAERVVFAAISPVQTTGGLQPRELAWVTDFTPPGHAAPVRPGLQRDSQ